MSQVFIGNVRARLAQSLDDSGNLERVPFVARNTSPKAESALPRLNQWLNRTLRSIVPKTPKLPGQAALQEHGGGGHRG